MPAAPSAPESGMVCVALRPVAGPLAGDLFGAGHVISAVAALSVLLATTAHVVGAQFGWRRGLSEEIGRARGFYAVLAASIGLALAVTLAGIPVIGLLVAASVIGGSEPRSAWCSWCAWPAIPGSWDLGPYLACWPSRAGPSLLLSAASVCSPSSEQPWARSDRPGPQRFGCWRDGLPEWAVQPGGDQVARRRSSGRHARACRQGHGPAPGQAASNSPNIRPTRSRVRASTPLTPIPIAAAKLDRPRDTATSRSAGIEHPTTKLETG